MKYDMDELLRNALSSQEEPDYWLNQKIFNKVREKEREDMSKRSRKIKAPAAALLTAAVLCVGSVTGYAAWKYLTPQQIAETVQDQGLAAAFQSEDAVAINEVQEYDGYRFTLLGIVSGKNLSQYTMEDDAGNILDDRTYVVTAIENVDGTPRPDTSADNYGVEPFFVSPLIQGLNPAIYNSITMGGGYSEIVENGVQYRISECDNVEKFADRQIYLCVCDGTFYNHEAYSYDEENGNISRNEVYRGVNALFSLPLDKSKADKQAAEEYIQNMEDEWNGNGEEEAAPSPEDDDVVAQASREVENWKMEDFGRNTELVKELELAPDEEGNFEYKYEISEDGPASEGTLIKEMLSERDEGNMAKIHSVMSGSDEQTAYVETYTLMEDGRLLLRVFKYSK